MDGLNFDLAALGMKRVIHTCIFELNSRSDVTGLNPRRLDTLRAIRPVQPRQAHPTAGRLINEIQPRLGRPSINFKIEQVTNMGFRAIFPSKQ